MVRVRVLGLPLEFEFPQRVFDMQAEIAVLAIGCRRCALPGRDSRVGVIEPDTVISKDFGRRAIESGSPIDRTPTVTDVYSTSGASLGAVVSNMGPSETGDGRTMLSAARKGVVDTAS